MELIKNDEAGRTAIEIIENVRTIQLLTREGTFYERYEQCSKGQKWNELGRAWFEAANYSISQSFQYFMMTITYALGLHIISMGQKRPEHVFQGIIAMLLGAVAVMDGASYFPEFVKAKTASGMLFAMIFRKPKTGDSSVGEKMNLQGNIHFKNVKFSYPQRPRQPVMTDLNFHASRGQTVALVGPSGSGKSTVISMIERFYDPTGGAVLFDGRNLKDLCLNNFRTQVALVGQEPRLFAGTIRENICFGLGNTVPEEEVDRAVELANAKRFLSNLPHGLDTEVGEKGTQMSGGQKQRIAIARALVRNPKILLLDEATSALDSESERAVQEALDKAREGRTCITIAHRLSSIQNSDLILFIENGKVRESGTHSSLIAQKGKYYNLIKKQDLT
uniref:ABC transporter domain-containing protein n=1 Tax=Steinernema glaseri TaxID=37863 RepID=A0A1I7Y218_9BILA